MLENIISSCIIIPYIGILKFGCNKSDKMLKTRYNRLQSLKFKTFQPK